VAGLHEVVDAHNDERDGHGERNGKPQREGNRRKADTEQ